MRTLSLVRLTCLLSLLLLYATVAFSQGAKVISLGDAQPNTQILYTGKLLGYFRIPEWQPGNTIPPGGCPDFTPAANKRQEDKTPTEVFFEQIKYASRAAILVGTGDNFAPEIESRVFFPVPANQEQVPGPYQRAGKELFTWFGKENRWVTNEEASGNGTLRALISDGRGTIPTDNVGCFLIKAGYAAVVPGKHDFYFGSERLRQLARFLATTPIPTDNQNASNRYVQMLGANLVIKTAWKGAPARPSDTNSAPEFIPGFPAMHHLLPENPLKLQLAGLRDGGTVYPWFQGPTLNIEGFDGSPNLLKKLQEAKLKSAAELRQRIGTLLKEYGSDEPDRNALQNLRNIVSKLETSPTRLCPAGKGDPNAITLPITAARCTEVALIPRMNGKTLTLRLEFPPLEKEKTEGEDLSTLKPGDHFSTVKPGENYGLCLVNTVGDSRGKTRDETFCTRFSVHVPFFYHPSVAPSPESTNSRVPKGYRDPEPYVLIEKDTKAGRPRDVAIFGVVDPEVRDSIGMLNFAWTNSDDNYKTETTIEDPAVALQQLLAYFEKRYEIEHPGKEFTGLKVLLAQMTPQRAQALSARLRQFNVIVTAANEELATGLEKTTIKWRAPSSEKLATSLEKTTSESSAPSTKDSPPPKYLNYLAVPEPYYLPPRTRVKIGSLRIAPLLSESTTWTLTSERFEERLNSGSNPEETQESQAPFFWKRVAEELNEECLLPEFETPFNAASSEGQRRNQIQLLALCAMRRAVGADVALVQKRDFFPELPRDAGDIGNPSEKLQEILDRILWKGDFLTLMYVPGSALTKVMRQSKTYDVEDTSKLTIVSERSRGLVTLGIKPGADPNEYLVNELPLDPNRLYAVATSDFIGAGDTGYPDLAAAAIGAAAVPNDFDKQLESVSSVVCRQLAGLNPRAACMGSLPRDEYLDKLTMKPADDRPNTTNSQRLRAWSIFGRPKPVPQSSLKPPAPGAETAVEEKVERRPIWELSLQKFSFSGAGLANNLSDEEIDDKFAGITTSSVNAHRKTNWAADLQMRLSRSSHTREFFISPRVKYDVEYLGVSNAPRQVTQLSNLSSIDTGVIFRAPNRALPHLDGIVSLHFETPTTRPFILFALDKNAVDPATNITGPPRLQFRQGRSWRLFPRLGVRWQDRVSSIEVGGQAGREFNAIAGYQFATRGVLTATCLPNASVTFAKCVKTASENGKINTGSSTEVLRNDRYHAGAYWKVNLTVPLFPRVSYVMEDEGEFFLANFGTDNATDTRFRDYSKHQLKVSIWPSLSIGPAFNLLFYENKVNRDFLRQQQIMFQVDLSFSLFNKREIDRQITYKQPTKSN